jgi:L-amino acid N-acyltransferase YncA
MDPETIRLATAADAAAVAAIYAPSITDAATSFELVPPTAEEMAGRIAAVAAYAPWLVLERGGDVAGYAYASRHRDRAAYQWSVDVSVYVAAGHHRRGVGRTLYTALFALLRLQGFHTAHAGIALPNAASVALHESFGFVPVGVYPSVGFKAGAWRDVGWWRLPLLPCDGPPAPPRTPAELLSSAEWARALSAT